MSPVATEANVQGGVCGGPASPGAVTTWFCSRPSLQAFQRYRSAPSHCGDGALTEVTERAITVRVNGVATVSDANKSRIPTGELRRAGDLGRARVEPRTVSVSVRPFGSVACSAEQEMRRVFVIRRHEAAGRDAGVVLDRVGVTHVGVGPRAVPQAERP